MKNKLDSLFFTRLFVPQASQSSSDRKTESEIQFAIPSTQSVCGMEIRMNERIEVMVKKKTSISMKLAQYALVALTVFFFLLCPILLGIFGLILAILTGVAAYFVKMRSVIEYEYTYFDKEMDVDVIYSMQKRKHLKTYDLSKLEVLAPKGSYHLDSYKNRQLKATDFSTHIPDNDKNVYEMYIGGSDRVIFEPTPELVKIIANIAPRKVFTD